MPWKRLEASVKPKILKLKEDSTIIKEERVILTLNAETYSVPITLRDDERGVLFFGNGDYLVNSRIRTNIGIYSKQYTDMFKGWGLIVGKAEMWTNARKHFTETEDFPEGFSRGDDFIKEAEKNLYRAISDHDNKGIEKADWFYRVDGDKGEASLHYKGGKIVFSGCNANLVSTSEDQLVLNEGDVNLVLHGDKTVLRSGKGKLVASGERVVSDIGVISGDKIVTRGFVGRRKDVVEKAKIKALSLLPKVLEEIGYKLE